MKPPPTTNPRILVREFCMEMGRLLCFQIVTVLYRFFAAFTITIPVTHIRQRGQGGRGLGEELIQDLV